MRCAFVLLAVCILVGPAAADIGIVRVAPVTARPGGTVRVTVNGYVGLRAATMPLVVVPAALLPRPFACKKGAAICEPNVWRGRLDRPPYRLVGFARRWRRDRDQPDHATAVAAVRVPRLRPGRYVVALWCGPCVRGPQGSLIAGPTLTVR